MRTRRARQDLIEIWSYIAADNQGAADKLLDRIDMALNNLTGNPGLGVSRPAFGTGVRQFSVGAYTIFYRPTSAGIQVLRVLHSARRIVAPI